ncbi:MAG: hypothetical protein ABL873_03825 [Gallionella sp.]
MARRFIPKQIFVLRAKAGDSLVYAADPVNLQPMHTDRIEEATKFDERDVGRFPTLIKFRKAITSLDFEAVQIN